MILIAGKLYVAAEHRAQYLASMEELIRHSRVKKGCLDFIMAADPVEESRINLFELWETEQDLRHHQATANPPEPITSIISEEVKKYKISKSGPVFPN